MPDIKLGDTHHSSREIRCEAEGCDAKLWLQQMLPIGWGLTGGHVDYALDAAARTLGWSYGKCPKHVDPAHDPLDPSSARRK